MKIQDVVRKLFLPYCIRPLGDGEYVLLNRNYKPLGYPHNRYLSEEEYQALLEKHAIKILNPQILKNLQHGGPRKDSLIYLYDDSIANKKEQADYLNKLNILASLSIEL